MQCHDGPRSELRETPSQGIPREFRKLLVESSAVGNRRYLSFPVHNPSNKSRVVQLAYTS